MKAAITRTILGLLLGLATSVTTRAHEEVELEEDAGIEFASAQLSPSNLGSSPSEAPEFLVHGKARAEVEIEEETGKEFESVRLGPRINLLDPSPAQAHKFLERESDVLTTMFDISSSKLFYDCYNSVRSVAEQPTLYVVHQLMENSEGTIQLIETKLGDRAFDQIVLCMAIFINVLLVWRFKFIWTVVFDVLLYSAYAYLGSKVVVGCSIGIALRLYDLLVVCAGHPVQVAVTVLLLILIQCLVWPVCRRQFWPSQTDRLEEQAKSLEQRLASIEEQLESLMEMLTDQGTQQEEVMNICERVERRLHHSGPVEDDVETDEDYL